MKEHNKPEEEVIPVPVKEKKPRPYLPLEEAEINDLISIYRKLLRIEINVERDTIISKIEILERELKRRGKLVKAKSE